MVTLECARCGREHRFEPGRKYGALYGPYYRFRRAGKEYVCDVCGGEIRRGDWYCVKEDFYIGVVERVRMCVCHVSLRGEGR